jgi:hypothetical protein
MVSATLQINLIRLPNTSNIKYNSEVAVFQDGQCPLASSQTEQQTQPIQTLSLRHLRRLRSMVEDDSIRSVVKLGCRVISIDQSLLGID